MLIREIGREKEILKMTGYARKNQASFYYTVKWHVKKRANSNEV